MAYYVHEVCIELWPSTGIFILVETYEKGTISHANCCSCTDPLLNYRTKLGYLQELFNYNLLKYSVTISKQYSTVWLGDRWTIGKDVEGTSCGQLETFLHLPEGSEENNENWASWLVVELIGTGQFQAWWLSVWAGLNWAPPGRTVGVTVGLNWAPPNRVVGKG